MNEKTQEDFLYQEKLYKEAEIQAAKDEKDRAYKLYYEKHKSEEDKRLK